MIETVMAKLAEFLEQLDGRATDSRRLLHGRGRCYPGLEHTTIDWFDPVVVVTLFRTDQAVSEAQLLAALKGLSWPERIQAVVIQRRYLANATVECLHGELPERLYARRHGSRFSIQLGENQNLGFFLDMEPGRAWLEQHCAGRGVLNLFAYTCAFSVVAQQAGASAVVNVDMSRAALGRGRDNHRLNDQPLETIQFLGENILKSWGRIRRPGPYDVIIFDPPSYQPGSFIAARDYPKLLRRIPELATSGADLLICLNAPELAESFIAGHMAEVCPEAVFIGRLENHPDFPDSNSEQQLKLLHYRYQGRNQSC